MASHVRKRADLAAFVDCVRFMAASCAAPSPPAAALCAAAAEVLPPNLWSLHLPPRPALAMLVGLAPMTRPVATARAGDIIGRGLYASGALAMTPAPASAVPVLSSRSPLAAPWRRGMRSPWMAQRGPPLPATDDSRAPYSAARGQWDNFHSPRSRVNAAPALVHW